MIKYLGSKRTLIPVIGRVLGAVADACRASGSPTPSTVLDLFSGTSRVGHALKRAGWCVLANDHNAYALALARCYVQADREDVLEDAAKLVREFNALPGSPGYCTETFCIRSRFFQPKNGGRIDAVREAIARKGLDPELEAVMLVSLMEAADRVDSTTGVQMAYLKDWAPRARNDLELRVPDVLPRAAGGKGAAFCMDALDAAASLQGDVAYLDPPYNQHSYLGNYHIWETLVRWDRPEAYGIACKRTDCRERQSPFNSRKGCLEAMRRLIDAAQAPILLVSFNNEGFIDRAAMESMLQSRGRVIVVENDYKRYVGAQIGIYNPQGEKVGKVGHLRNTEFLYAAGPADIIDAAERAILATSPLAAPATAAALAGG